MSRATLGPRTRPTEPTGLAMGPNIQKVWTIPNLLPTIQMKSGQTSMRYQQRVYDAPCRPVDSKLLRASRMHDLQRHGVRTTTLLQQRVLDITNSSKTKEQQKERERHAGQEGPRSCRGNNGGHGAEKGERKPKKYKMISTIHNSTSVHNSMVCKIVPVSVKFQTVRLQSKAAWPPFLRLASPQMCFFIKVLG